MFALFLSLPLALAHAHPHLDCPEGAPAEEAASITVVLAADLPVTGIEVACPEGFVGEATFEHGVARVAPMPRQSCQLTIMGDVTEVLEVVPDEKLLCTGHTDLRCVSVARTLSDLGEEVPVRPGGLSIAIDSVLPYSSVEVSCLGGYRQRVTLQDGEAELSDLPAATCRATLKGGTPRSVPVTGGMSVQCQTRNDELVCQPR